MLGFEVSPVVQYVIAFAIIAALLGLFAIVLRRIGGKRFTLPGQDRGRGRQPRLGIVDVYDLDRQRQLVLLRRDNVEHLVMLGGPNDLVVESNIMRVPVSRAPVGNEYPPERLAQAEPAPEQGRTGVEPAIAASAGGAVASMVARSPEPAPREPVMQQRPQQAPSAPLRQQAPQQSPYPGQPQQRLEPKAEPGRTEPEAGIFDRQPSASAASVSASESESESSTIAPAASQPSAAEVVPQPPAPVQEEPPQVPPQVAPQAAPQPVRPLAQAEAPRRTELKSFEPVVTTAPPPPPEPRRGLFGFGRAVEKPAPLPAFPSRPRATPVAPDFAPQRTPPKFAPAAEEKPSAPEARREAGVFADPAIETKQPSLEKPAAQVAAPKSGRPLDDAILSDMARQLEAALKRPASAVTPNPAQRPAQPSPAPRAAAAPASPAAPPLAPAPPPAPTSAPPPSPADDWSNERKLYTPVVTAAAAVGAVAAMASALRPSPATESKGTSDPVPPRPYGGGGAVDADERTPPVEAAREEVRQEEVRQEEVRQEETEQQDIAVQSAAAAPEAVTEVEFEADVDGEATVQTEAAQDVPQHAEGAVEAREVGEAVGRDEERPSEQPLDVLEEEAAQDSDQERDGEQPATGDDASARADEGERSAAASAPAASPPETAPVEAAPVEAAPVEAAPVEAAPVEAEEQAASEEKREPAPAAIDPFSVDEIEAEFARLLGRSVEKDTKSL
jgi:flagellar protein FliO/FliZ